MFYFFRHTQDAHKLVIADELTAFQEMPGVSPLVYDEISGGLRDEARVSSWIKTQELGPGKCSLQDYCFEKPSYGHIGDTQLQVPYKSGVSPTS